MRGFNDPVKSKMRAIPSQKGLGAVRTASVLPLPMPYRAGPLELRLCSNPCLVLKAIYSLSNLHHGPILEEHSITPIG